MPRDAGDTGYMMMIFLIPNMNTHVIMTEGILKYSRFCDKNILMIHFLLLSQNYPQPDNEIHQKNLCSRSSKI